MAEAAKAETTTIMENLSPARIVESQRRNTALFSEMNELLLKTARAFWENQTELFRSQAEHASKGLTPLRPGENPAVAISAYCDQLHERTDHLVTHMRKTNDLLMDYGWQLLSIYTRGFRQTAQDVQSSDSIGRSSHN